MSRTDEQLVIDVREAVRAAPLGHYVALDEVVAVGRRRVRARRALGAGGVLVAAAVAGAVAFSLGGTGLLGAAPSDPAGRGGQGPSVSITSPPDSPTRLYDALDARLEALGMPTEDVGWGSRLSGSDPYDNTIDSGFGAGTLHLGFGLSTARSTEAIDLTDDLCAGLEELKHAGPQMGCTQTALADGSQLLRLTWRETPTEQPELQSLMVMRPGGWVRVDSMLVFGPSMEVIETPANHEEQLLEIVTDPALQW